MTTARAVGSQVITGGGEALQGLAVLRILRLTRVVRVFKMSRNFQGLVLLLTTFQARRPVASSRRAVPLGEDSWNCLISQGNWEKYLCTTTALSAAEMEAAKARYNAAPAPAPGPSDGDATVQTL